MLWIGIVLVLVSSYLSSLIIGHKIFSSLYNLSFFNDFTAILLVFCIAFVIYYIFQSLAYKKLNKEITLLNNRLSEYTNTTQDTQTEIELKTPILKRTFNIVKSIIEKQTQLQKNLEQKLNNLQFDYKNMEEIMDYEDVVVFKINKSGKVVKANQKALSVLGIKSEGKLNLKYKNIEEIFDTKLPNNWLETPIQEVFLNNKKYKMSVSELYNKAEYVLSLVDITDFDKKCCELENKLYSVSEHIKTSHSLNKSFEILMIKVVNYDRYIEHFSSAILELFDDAFAQRIASLGYKEVFRVSDGLFAVYDLHPPFDKYKKILEENLIVNIANNEYIFNPIIVMGSGVNYDQARQQISETSRTFVNKVKDKFKYNLEEIKVLNECLKDAKVVLGYRMVSDGAIFIYPFIKDPYNEEIKNVTQIAREFNFYLQFMKVLLLGHLPYFKDKKLIINVTSDDLLSHTLLMDILSLIQREELNVVFNVKIDSKYKIIFPVLKMLKSYVQIGFGNIGNSFVNFKDIYLLKVEYLEVDESVVKLLKNDNNWRFLLGSIKMLVSAQKTKVLLEDYPGEKDSVCTVDKKLFFKS